MVDRQGLAAFLRRRRTLLRPADVGLAEGVRRRTPGLRREEVAQLAGISTDYYSRIEQNRGPNPSEPIIASLAQALRLDPDERDYLYRLAGLAPPPRRPGRFLSPGLLRIADRLTDIPVVIATDLEVVLWQNALATAVTGPAAAADGVRASITWQWFTGTGVRNLFPEQDWPLHSAAHVAGLRATSSRRGGDSDVRELVRLLRETSDEFRRLWDVHEAGVRRLDRKTFLVPQVGPLQLTCEDVLTSEADIRMRAFFPTEGTDAREKLELLAVIGTQRFDVTALP
ncbi:helix-turn-helix transcriptional regulator [Nocardia carnea]|uniref:helix-turn-helix transcriptional regulator n=1 Tax=Nocardia carnea TaxID=37328 RepID=UPI002456EC94|nr:helix-turn-helix transcriptional regulator [Nocardia carnea]